MDRDQPGQRQKANSDGNIAKPRSEKMSNLPAKWELAIDCERIYKRLIGFSIQNYATKADITLTECLFICREFKDRIKCAPLCIEVDYPVMIVGDIHGQFHDLLRFFDKFGFPCKGVRYLFLGDYVDRGKYSLEVIILLFSAYIKYGGDTLFLLRGNHEALNVCRRYGFALELMERYEQHAGRVLAAFVSCFRAMPICAVVGKELFCCHGGISPFFELAPFSPSGRGSQAKNIRAINSLDRYSAPAVSGAICDIMWADPLPTSRSETLFLNGYSRLRRWSASARSCSFLFSEEALKDMLQQFEVKMLIRAHQVVSAGYSFGFNKKYVTIFSAPGYSRENNDAAVMQFEKEISDDYCGVGFVLKTPNDRNPDKLFWSDTELSDIKKIRALETILAKRF